MEETIEWMSTADAAEYLGVQSRTLYRFIDEGDLAAYRFGRVIRLQRRDVMAFVQSCRIEPGTMGAHEPNGRGGTDEPIGVASAETTSIASTTA